MVRTILNVLKPDIYLICLLTTWIVVLRNVESSLNQLVVSIPFVVGWMHIALLSGLCDRERYEALSQEVTRLLRRSIWR